MQWLEKSSGFTQVQGLRSFKSTLTRLFYATHHSFSLPEPRQIKPRALGVILSTSKSRRLSCCNLRAVATSWIKRRHSLSTSAVVCLSTTFGSTFSVSSLGWSRAVVQEGRRLRDRCAWSGWQCRFQRPAFPAILFLNFADDACRWPLPKHHSASRTFSWRLRLCSGLEENATLLQLCGARWRKLRSRSSFFNFLFFFIYKIQTPVTRGWSLECTGGGAACTQPTCGLGVVAQALHQKKQRVHGWREGRDKGNNSKKKNRGSGRFGNLWKCWKC